MSDYIQFDASKTIVGGINIAEALDSDKKLVFNESYTIAGERLIASSVYACYDLTVLGSMEVDDIEVKGNLYVIGDIKTKRLTCFKAIICSGDIDAEVIFSSEIIANDVACRSMVCTGNIVVRTTIDISESLKTERLVLTGEGILGAGQFSAKSAVAAEYFDFNGEVFGKVLELETETTFGRSHTVVSEKETFEDFITRLKQKIATELKKAGEVNEGQLVKFVSQLSALDEDILSDWKRLTEDLIELSYLKKITNLRDYLIIIMAKKLLPEEIVGYETIEHVFNNLLTEAERELGTLAFRAKSVADFAYALKIVSLCENELGIDKNEVFDRIFQSVGIKYKTVRSFIG